MPQKNNNTDPSLAVYSGNWGNDQIVHLLKRTMFGAKKTDLDHFANKKLVQAVDELLQPIKFNEPPPVNDYDFLNIQHVMPGKAWIDAPYYEPHDGFRISSFAKWAIHVLINQDRSLREKMALFWHNHFATQTDIGHSTLIWNHYNVLRDKALGNFKDLTRSITIDGHMLRYLNGEKNTKLAPNENYARELQELFCIGKGVNAKFTEDDVKQAAKVLTGWEVDLEANTGYFKEEDHDNNDKKFSAFYNSTIISGRKGPSAGLDELNGLLDMIFNNPETALFICRKLYRWFVYYKIDDEIEKNIIIPLANTLRKNNYEIKPLLKALFTSTHFFDENLYGGQVKSPVDFIIGMQREFNVAYQKPENYIKNNSMYLLILENMQQMGQAFTDPPNVSGWPAYYQSPGFYELWINTSTYPARREFSNAMINYGYNREGSFFSVDVVAFAGSFSNPEDPDALINDSLELLYRLPVSEDSKKMLKKNTLLTGQEQDHYWTDAWNDHIKTPDDNIKRYLVEIRLKSLYSYIVNSPEYQLA